MSGLYTSTELLHTQKAEIILSEQLEQMLELAIEQLVTFRGELIGEIDVRLKEQLEHVVAGSSPSAEFARRVIVGGPWHEHLLQLYQIPGQPKGKYKSETIS